MKPPGRAVDHKTLVFLRWARDHQDDIKPSLSRKLYEKLEEQAGLPRFVEAGVFRVSLREAADHVRFRLTALRGLDEQVEVTNGGDTVLKGTNIEVHRIAALIEGDMSRDEVLGDYPSLNPDQLDFAVSYTAAHPKPDRHYPKLTVKAALRQADLSALDID